MLHVVPYVNYREMKTEIESEFGRLQFEPFLPIISH